MESAVLTGCFLAAWSFLFAVLEIAVEGRVGWALAAPTWRRRSRLYGALMSGKELTGYHLSMFFLTLLLLHMPFVFAAHWGFGGLWTIARECELLAYYFLLCAHWDFQWFVLNPHFGTKRFRRGEIWWHRRWFWRIPDDYVIAVCLALMLTAAARYAGGTAVWTRFGIVVATLLIALFVVEAYAELFHKWHGQLCWKYMLVSDEWERWLGNGDARRLKQLLVEIDERRREVAGLGRRRARREQIGIEADTPAAAAPQDDRGENC